MPRVALLSIAFFLIGCGQKNPLVGRWVSNDSPLEIRVDFKDGGTFDLVAEGKLAGMYRIIGDGTYKLDDKTLTMKGGKVSATVDGKPMQEAALKSFKEGFEKEISAPVVWDGADKFSYTNNGQVVNFKKVTP